MRDAVSRSGKGLRPLHTRGNRSDFLCGDVFSFGMRRLSRPCLQRSPRVPRRALAGIAGEKAVHLRCMMFTFRAKTALFLVFGLTLVGCVGAEIVDGDSEVGRPDTGRGDVQTDPGASDATQPDVTEDPLSDPSTDVPVDTVGDEGTTTDAVDDPVVDTGMDATPDVPIGDPECGNGVLEAGEDCDDGIGNSDSTRDACRTDCTAPSCGDSVTDSGEQCDDGNSDDQDDCANSCVFVLAGLCAPCTEDTECGRPQDRCLALPGGSSCGAACTDNTDCPDGFVCDVAPSGGSNQCQPESGVCTGCFDPDRDGYGQGDSCLGLDCDESRSDRNPGRTEVCNEFDDDCDDVIDEGSTVAEYWPDNDMDGFGSNTASSRMSCDPPTGYVGNNADCNDGDANRNPNATELCDTLDNDCDDSADEGLGSTNFYPDTDNDGYGDSAASPVTGCAQPSGFVPDNSDCNDGSNAVYPGATEVCDGLNNDCDGSTDEGLSPTSYWPDTDNDGYGDASASPTMACVAPAGYGREQQRLQRRLERSESGHPRDLRWPRQQLQRNPRRRRQLSLPTAHLGRQQPLLPVLRPTQHLDHRPIHVLRQRATAWSRSTTPRRTISSASPSATCSPDAPTPAATPTTSTAMTEARATTTVSANTPPTAATAGPEAPETTSGSASTTAPPKAPGHGTAAPPHPTPTGTPANPTTPAAKTAPRSAQPPDYGTTPSAAITKSSSAKPSSCVGARRCLALCERATPSGLNSACGSVSSRCSSHATHLTW